MAKRSKITAQDMNDLFIDALSGDSDAETEYRRLARLQAKSANQQMLTQERKDVTGEAYRRTQEFLGSEEGARFKENNRNIALEDLQEQVKEIFAFKNARDYSVPYATKSRAEIDALESTLSAAGIDIEDARVTFWMNELFKTGAWKEYKKAHGRSTDLIRSAQDAFQQGKTVDDLLAAYEDYTSGRDGAPDLIEAWEEFAEWR